MARPRFIDERDLGRKVHVFNESGEKPRGTTPEGLPWTAWDWSASAGPRDQYLGKYTLGDLHWN